MTEPSTDFRKAFSEAVRELRSSGKPSRETLMATARSLAEKRIQSGSPGLWKRAPRMALATVDDGWGHGLEVIRAWAEAAGMEVRHLGLMVAPDAIIDACRKWSPGVLGMTVLQFDTEEAMAQIRRGIPSSTQIVAGGPLFRADPELAKRAGIDVVAADAAAFGEFLLAFSPSPPRQFPEIAP
ncbi:MAG: cobalamin B12-binding domain-containing protein [Desulfococcaceae bacterium]